MTEYTDQITIAMEPRLLFEYLSDVENVSRYMPRVTAAHAIGDQAVEVHARPRLADGTEVDVTGTAWVRTNDPGRTLSWGSVGGRHNYRGTFDVDPHEDGGSRLYVRITSERADGDAVRAGLREALVKIKELAEAS